MDEFLRLAHYWPICFHIGFSSILFRFSSSKKGLYFFEVFGKNTLAIYLLSQLLVPLMWRIPISGQSSYVWFYENIFQPVGDYFAAFLFAFVYMMIFWFVGYILDKKKIYIKI